MTKDFVSEHVVEHYDQHIRKLIPGYDLVHLHIQAILQSNFKQQAKRVLVAGCGTGFELAYLLNLFPDWQFVAIDLSPTMIEKARAHVHQLGMHERVEFICADVIACDYSNVFDLTLCILVSHFVPYSEKNGFFEAISKALKTGGMFLTFDLMQFADSDEAAQLQYVCEQQGLSSRQTEAMLTRLNDDYAVISEPQTLTYLQDAGFTQTKKFIHLVGYCGFYTFKA